MPVTAAPTASAVFPSSLGGSAHFDALSTSGTTAPPVPAPAIVSASRSPTRALPSTPAGRSGMSARPGMWPRPAWAPPFRFGLFPRRRGCRQSRPPALRSAWTCRWIH